MSSRDEPHAMTLIGFVSVQVGSSDLMWTASTSSKLKKPPVSGTSSLAPSLTRETGSVLVVASLLTSSQCGADTMATFYKNCDHRGRWKGDPLDFLMVKVVSRQHTKREVVSLLESIGFKLYWIKKSKSNLGEIIWTAKTKNDIYGKGIRDGGELTTARLNWITYDADMVSFWHRTNLDLRKRLFHAISLGEKTLEPYTY